MFSSNETPLEEFAYANELGAIINLDDFTHIQCVEDTLGYIPETISCRYNPGGVFAMSNGIMDNPGDAKYGFTPEQMVEEYKKAGYHFLAISDHDFYTDFREQFNEEQFLTIPAFECSAILYCEEGRKERFKVHHLHGILGTSEVQAQAVKPVYRHMEQIPKRIFYGTWDGAKCCQDMVDSLKDQKHLHRCIRSP